MRVKNWLLRHLPHPESVFARSALLRPLAGSLGQPALWSLQRRKVAMAVAVGLFAGLMPGPVQMLLAALLALLFRINLPVAMVCTLYSNPLTIFPLYFLAFGLGKFLLGVDGNVALAPLPAPGEMPLQQWPQAMLAWGASVGRPLLLGLPALGLTLAGGGYVIVMVLWRYAVLRQWRKRKETRGSD